MEKIQKKKAVIGIIGLGYVGSALANLVLQKGYPVIGFEKNEKKKPKHIKEKNFIVTMDTLLLQNCDIIIICIQTPIYDDKTPNLEYLEVASQEVADHLQKGQLITIESSINPGITRNIVLPYLEKSGLKPSRDFFLAFSPERIDPGNTQFSLGEIPKVVSGLDKNSLTLIQTFYEYIFNTVVPVSSLETAEMVKILENTFRLINISLVNELKEYTKAIDIDIWEVINAAATKPFGFLPHYPGPGVGGHCIPVDPFYLFFDAQKKGLDLRLIETAGIINDQQPYTIVENTLQIAQKTYDEDVYKHILKEEKNIAMQSIKSYEENLLAEQLYTHNPIGIKGGISKKSSDSRIKKFNILLIGITYKPNIDDTRESAAIKIWELFEKLGHTVSYHDPFVPTFHDIYSVPLSEEILKKNDVYVIVTNHSTIDYDYLISFGKPIIDTRHVYPEELSHIYYV